MMKRLFVSAGIIALTACSPSSDSPIKQVVCKNDQGRILNTITFDPIAKRVYVFDAFAETLKPVDKFHLEADWDSVDVAFTDSSKIKIRAITQFAPNDSLESLEVIDLKALTLMA